MEENTLEAREWLSKGIGLSKTGWHQESVACFDRALNLNPHDADTWYNKAVALRQQVGSYLQDVCGTGRVASEELFPSWNECVVAKEKKERHTEEMACLGRALSLNPELAEAWLAKGIGLGELARHEEALACHERALSLNPLLAEAWFKKGWILENSLRCHFDALACFEQTRRLGFKLAAKAIAYCRLKQGK